MSRREKLFWLCAGAVLIVLFLSLIPSHYEICEISEKTKEEHCARYQVVQFLGIKVPQILDRIGGVLTALATLAIAAFTLTLKRATDRLWDAGERQLKLAADSSAAQSRDMQASIKAAEDAAKAAARSADIADRLLVISSRPWVDLRVEIVGALKFDPVEGCLLKIKLTLINIGRSPAIDLSYFIDFCPSISQAVDKHQQMVLSSRSMFRVTGFGHTRFPNDPFEIEMAIGATPAEIEAATKENESGLVQPYIVACAYYGLPTGGKFRYTSINRAIYRTDDEVSGFAPVGEYSIDKMELYSINTGQTT